MISLTRTLTAQFDEQLLPIQQVLGLFHLLVNRQRARVFGRVLGQHLALLNLQRVQLGPHIVDGAGRKTAGQRLVDASGQTTRLAFDAFERNVALPADLFRFAPPAGADVVEAPAAT